jgi:transposase
VLIRATLGSSAKEIAQLLGWATTTVHVIHSRWAKEGESIFDLHGRGGRHNQHLTSEQEADLLAPFTKTATGGEMLHVSEIKKAFEERVGVPVAASTVYRMLDRHGWRKVVPRPRHPKADLQAQAAFKKTPQSGGSRGQTSG